jgi:transposase
LQHLKILLGIGKTLAVIIQREISTFDRFPTAGNPAAYAGVVPEVRSSTARGALAACKQANNYLKRDLIEAAIVIVAHQHRPNWRLKKVSQIYDRISH